MAIDESLADLMLTRPHYRLSRIGRDLAMVIVLAMVASGAGLSINHFSSKPLPIVYQTPKQRFDQELTMLVAAAPFAIAPAATVDLSQFRNAVTNKSALILDARPAVFFERGHVPGALNLSRDDFSHDYRRLDGVLKAAQGEAIIVYCSGGECHDSRLIANALLSLGFSDVSVYTGGWDEWSDAHLAEATGRPR